MHIRFHKLTARNALCWKRLQLRLDNRGLSLICGPNGSGKTSIAEVMSHILYEQTTKSGRKDAIINRSAKRRGHGFKGVLELSREENGKWVTYEIRQTRGVAGKKTGTVVTSNGKLVHTTPQELIGLTWEEFKSIVYLPQRTVHPLVTGTPSTRARYITDAYNLSEIDRKHKEAKRLRDSLKDKCNTYTDLQSKLALLKEQSKTCDINRLSKTLDVLTGKLSVVSNELVNADSVIDKKLRVVAGQKRRAQLIKSLGTTGAVNSQNTRKLLRAKTAEYNRLMSSVHMARKQEKDREKLAKEVDDLLRRLPKQVPAKVSQKRIDAKIAEGAVLDEHYRTCKLLRGKKTCPTCKQPIPKSEASEKHLLNLSNKVLRNKTEIAHLEKAKRQHEKYVEITREIDRRRKRIEELGGTPVVDVSSETRRLLNDTRSLEKQLNEELKYDAMTDEMRSLPKGDHRKTEKKIRGLQATKNELSATKDEITSKLSTVREKYRNLGAILNQITAVKNSMAQTEEDVRLYRIYCALVNALGNRGIKLDRIREIQLGISERLLKYTSELLPQYAFELLCDEKAVTLRYSDKRDSSGTYNEVTSMSEGEKKRLSLALLLSERDIREVTTNLLFLDEFDGGLDETGRESLISILGELVGVYSSIFCVSHTEDVIENPMFRNKYRIGMDGMVPTL